MAATKTLGSILFESLAGAAVVCLAPISAADSNDLEPASLNPVVVSATRSPRPLSDVAGTVRVIDAHHIEARMAQNPADVVRYEPGVSARTGGGRFGTDGFTIRGIGGNRVAIEVDGVPVGDRFDIGNFSYATRDLIDNQLVERIEILSGPASTLYGSDALGGIVSYSTWDPANLVDDVGVPYFSLRSGYFDDDNTWKNSARAALAGEHFGALAVAIHQSGSELDNGAANGDLIDDELSSGFTKFTWRRQNDDELAVTLDGHESHRDSDIRSVLGSGRFRNTTALTGDDEQRGTRLSARYDFAVASGIADSGRALVYRIETETDQRTIEERASLSIQRQRRFHYEQRAYGASVHLNRDLTAGRFMHRLGYGLEATTTKTRESRDGTQTDTATGTVTNVVLGEEFPVRDFPVTDTREVGVYLHDEISGPDRWTLIPALRFDWYDLDPRPDAVYRDDNPGTPAVAITERSLSPKLGLLVDVGEHWSVFGQYSHGFRAPPFEDANIGLDIPLFNIRALPNPDLESERSDGFELGVRQLSATTRLELSAYYTDYRDFIESQVNLGPDPQTGTLLFQSQNISSAHIYGAELRWQHHAEIAGGTRGRLRTSAALNWTRGRNDVSGEALNSVDPAEAVVTLNYLPQDGRWDATLLATFVDAKDEVDETRASLFKPDGYGVIDLIVGATVSDSLQVRAGLYNLTDKRYWRWADTRGLASDDPVLDTLAAPGRNFAISFNLNL